MKQYCFCWIYLQVHKKWTIFNQMILQKWHIIGVQHIVAFDNLQQLRCFLPIENFLRRISYDQAREPIYVLISLLVKSYWNVPKEQLANNKIQHAYIYMCIGNRHQRQWWTCFSVWATWQCLMGLIRQAVRVGWGCPAWCQCACDLLG